MSDTPDPDTPERQPPLPSPASTAFFSPGRGSSRPGTPLSPIAVPPSPMTMLEYIQRDEQESMALFQDEADNAADNAADDAVDDDQAVVNREAEDAQIRGDIRDQILPGVSEHLSDAVVEDWMEEIFDDMHKGVDPALRNLDNAPAITPWKGWEPADITKIFNEERTAIEKEIVAQEDFPDKFKTTLNERLESLSKHLDDTAEAAVVALNNSQRTQFRTVDGAAKQSVKSVAQKSDAVFAKQLAEKDKRIKAAEADRNRVTEELRVAREALEDARTVARRDEAASASKAVFDLEAELVKQRAEFEAQARKLREEHDAKIIHKTNIISERNHTLRNLTKLCIANGIDPNENGMEAFEYRKSRKAGDQARGGRNDDDEPLLAELDFRDAVSGWGAERTKMEADVESLRAELAKAQQTITRLEAERLQTVKDARTPLLRRKSSQLSTGSENVPDDSSQQSRRSSVGEDFRIAMRKEVKRLTGLLAETEERLKISEAALKKLREQRDRAATVMNPPLDPARMTSLEAELADAQQTRDAEVKDELEPMQQRIAENQERLNSEEVELARLSEQCQELEENLRALGSSSKDYSDELTQRLENKLNARNRTNSIINDLRADLEKLNDAFKKEKDYVQGLDEKVKNTEAKISATKALDFRTLGEAEKARYTEKLQEVEDLKSAKIRKERELAGSRDKYEKLEALHDEVVAERDALLSRNAELNKGRGSTTTVVVERPGRVVTVDPAVTHSEVYSLRAEAILFLRAMNPIDQALNLWYCFLWVLAFLAYCCFILPRHICSNLLDLVRRQPPLPPPPAPPAPVVPNVTLTEPQSNPNTPKSAVPLPLSPKTPTQQSFDAEQAALRKPITWWAPWPEHLRPRRMYAEQARDVIRTLFALFTLCAFVAAYSERKMWLDVNGARARRRYVEEMMHRLNWYGTDPYSFWPDFRFVTYYFHEAKDALVRWTGCAAVWVWVVAKGAALWVWMMAVGAAVWAWGVAASWNRLFWDVVFLGPGIAIEFAKGVLGSVIWTCGAASEYVKRFCVAAKEYVLGIGMKPSTWPVVGTLIWGLSSLKDFLMTLDASGWAWVAIIFFGFGFSIFGAVLVGGHVVQRLERHLRWLWLWLLVGTPLVGSLIWGLFSYKDYIMALDASGWAAVVLLFLGFGFPIYGIVRVGGRVLQRVMPYLRWLWAWVWDFEGNMQRMRLHVAWLVWWLSQGW